MGLLMPRLLLWIFLSVTAGELLQNGGFESLSHWNCNTPVHCELTTTAHSGHHAVKVTGRKLGWQGPSQFVHVQAGGQYHASGWVKLLEDRGHSQNVQLTVAFKFTDNTDRYVTVSSLNNVRVSSNWVHLHGEFNVSTNKPIQQTRIYFHGPDPAMTFLVDDASVTHVGEPQHQQHLTWRNVTDDVINRLRKSDIHIHVTTSSNVQKSDVSIHILQTKKSFPFGTVVHTKGYNENEAGGRYRDFIHRHFNWAVPGNSLKWYSIERNEGERNFQQPLELIHRLRSHGIKVRGHNLIWSVEKYVQGWVKQLTGDALRHAVQHHIQDTMNVTRGLLEHWDVNNENIHGHWYEHQLHDPDYNLEVFRIAHNADPTMQLFLNDYGVVSSSGGTTKYLAQAKQVKAANLGLYGVGVQCHFGHEADPNPDAIKQRLDTLAQAGLPIWVTELDVSVHDQDKRADFLERALRAVYGHPAVEGILLWGFWDLHHWRGPNSALVKGDNLDLLPAGRRFLDLVENQWMTDETHVLSQSRDTFTVRGFHGDYELHVIYQGHDLTNLTKTFTLGKTDHNINVNVHV